MHRVNDAAIRRRDLVTMQKGRPKTQKVRGKGRYKAFTPKTIFRTTLLEMICFVFFMCCRLLVNINYDQLCFFLPSGFGSICWICRLRQRDHFISSHLDVTVLI